MSNIPYKDGTPVTRYRKNSGAGSDVDPDIPSINVDSIAAGDNNIGNVDLASAIPAGTNLVGKVGIDQVTANANEVVVKSITAGDTNIGNVDVASLPAGNLGMQAMAASQSVVPANNITDATYIGDIKFGESLPAGTALMGKVGIDQTTPGTTNGVQVNAALPAGDNNIGNIDVATVPAPLSVVGGGTEAAAMRVTLANDSTGVVTVDDGGGSLTVDATHLDVRHLVAADDTVVVTGGAAQTADVKVTLDSETVVLGAGSAAVGKLAANDAVDIGDVTVNNAAGSGVYIRPGTSVNLDTSAIAGTVLTNIDNQTDAIGATTDAPLAGTGDEDANARTLISLLKRLVNFTIDVKTAVEDTSASAVSVADGGDVALGAIADAIVAAGATGTISAKLRRITQGLEDLKTLVVLAAGNNNIGNVDIDSFPSAQIGQKAMAASLSTVPANNITDATYVGDIKFGEALPAGESHLGEVGGKTTVTPITFSMTNAECVDGEVLADTQVLAACLRVNDGTGVIQDAVFLDEDDLGIAFDVIVFNANTSLGTENDVISISDANARNIVGRFQVLASDWYDLGGSRIANIKNIGIAVKGATGADDIYVGLISRGTVTHTASGITGHIKILCD